MNRTSRHGRALGFVSVALALLAALALFGFRAAAPVAAQEASVEIVDFAFTPGTIEVAAGTTVTWTNSDSAPHTATADDGSFDTGTLQPGESGSVTFDTPGTYTYVCSIHPNMTGTVVVTGGADDGAANDGDDTAGDASTGTGAATTNLPSSGTGAALGADTNLPLVAALLALAAMLGFAGAVVLRRGER